MFFLIHNLGVQVQYLPYYLPNVLLMVSVNPLASLLKAAIASIAFLCSSSSFFNSGFIFILSTSIIHDKNDFVNYFITKFSTTKKAPVVNRSKVIHIVL